MNPLPFSRIRAALIPPKPELVDRRRFPDRVAGREETLPLVRSSPFEKPTVGWDDSPGKAFQTRGHLDAAGGSQGMPDGALDGIDRQLSGAEDPDQKRLIPC